MTRSSTRAAVVAYSCLIVSPSVWKLLVICSENARAPGDTDGGPDREADDVVRDVRARDVQVALDAPRSAGTSPGNR